MEGQGKKRSLLRDLALIYIALAHGTDQDLSEVEVEAISRRLSAWQSQVTEETVLSAIKDALEDYTQESAQAEVEASAKRVRDQLETDRLASIVEDLTDIAMADDRFLHEEGTFIGDLARSWGVHVEESGAEDSPFSILTDNGNGHEGWTPLHDLALVYLHLAHRTDADLDTREIEAISGLLNEWIPDIKEDRILNVVQEAMHAYVQGPDKRLFEDSVESLKTAVPKHQRASILDDLEQIARADGQVLQAEQDVIDMLIRAWEIESV